MWDSFFVLIHHFNKPYKKKDILYLINSRLNNPKKKSLIISADLNIQSKCSDCKEFQSWILLKNSGEGLFLLKKLVEKCQPWITITIQENLYKQDYTKSTNFESIFSLITKINSREKLFDLIEEYKDVIINSDIRLKNQCVKCKDFFPWIVIKNEQKGQELAKLLLKNYEPYCILKKQKTLYKHNIPERIKGLEKWNWKMEAKFGNLKIEI